MIGPMYLRHDAFDSPSEPKAKLWRYMDFAKALIWASSSR